MKPSSCSRLHSYLQEPASHGPGGGRGCERSPRGFLNDSGSRAQLEDLEPRRLFSRVVAIAAGSSSELYGVSVSEDPIEVNFLQGSNSI